MNFNVLVTGGFGFVGKQIVNQLDSHFCKTTVIIRPENESEFIKYNSNAEYIITEDMFRENEYWWKNQCKNIDIIIHAAWYAKPGEYHNSLKNISCLTGSLEMVKGAIQAGVQKIVGIGTCLEYDSNFKVFDINSPLNPNGLYSSTKAALYLILKDWLQKADVKFAWCRLFYLYGEGENEERLVPFIHKKLKNNEDVELSTGNQIRDYLDVKEAGRQIAHVAINDLEGVYNICSGIPLTVRQISENVAREYNKLDKLKFGLRESNSIEPLCIVGIPSIKYKI